MRSNHKWINKAPGAFLKLQELWLDPEFSFLSMGAQAVAMRAGWLCFCLGTIPDDPYMVAQLTMSNAREFEKHWPQVSKWFERIDENTLTHPWWTKSRDAAFARQARAQLASAKGLEVQRAKRAKKARPFDPSSVVERVA